MSHIANGHRCLTSTIHSDPSGLVGDFTVVAPFHFGVGERIQIMSDSGTAIADGFIRSIARTSDEVSIQWTSMSPWRVNEVSQIIDYFAQDLARRRPA